MTRSVEIPEAAVEAAVSAFENEVTRQGAVDDTDGQFRDTLRQAIAAALPYLVPAEQEDTRTEEEKGFVEIALNAVDAGNAGSWPTVAGYLADEVRRLRAAPVGDGGLREALERLADELEPIDDTVSAYTIRALLAAYPAAPAVPQPVDREAIEHALNLHWWDEDAEPCVCGFDFIAAGQSFKMHLADVIAAVLAGEQEQVESP